MRIESELQNYQASWSNKPRSEIVDGILSFAMETKRVPDTYYFELGERGKLIDPKTKEPIENSISRSPGPYDKEYEGFKHIENWVRQNNQGTIIWLSPPYEGAYPFSKVVISEIQTKENKKTLLNRAIVLEINTDETVSLANSLLSYSSVETAFLNPEELRAKPIPLDLLRGNNWETVVLHILNDNSSWKMIKNGEDISIKEVSRPKAEAIYHKLFVENNPYYWSRQEQKELLSIFGQKGGSCPTPSKSGAFGKFFENSSVHEATFDCPKCHKQIPSGMGITKCPHCGVTKSEWGSSCD